jgi:peptide/nickel transport system substrate-binding protein
MNERDRWPDEVNAGVSRWYDGLLRTYSIHQLDRLQHYVNSLSAGDRVLAGLFGTLICIASLASVYTLEQHLLVRIPAEGGIITEGEVGSPRFVNPLLAISDADRDLTALTYAGLMGISGTGALIPVIAEKYSVSDDGKTYTFTLRTNARFSDGSPITADDVVFTVQKTQDPALKSPQFANWSGVTALATDAHTVTFTLTKPYAPFLENTTLGILPARLWRNIPNEQFPFSTLAIEPIGAGPYVPERISRDSGALITGYTLSANKYYALGKPNISKITFNFFSREEDLADALARGAVQNVYGHESETTLTAPYARIFGVFFNQSNNALFARSEVREALSKALDRTRITEEVLGGFATPIMGPVPPGAGIHNTPIPISNDLVKKASEVLEASGWHYDATLREWKQAANKLVLATITLKTSNVPELKAVATAAKEDWEKLGIRVDVELYEPGDLNQNVLRPRKYDALLFGMVIGRDKDLFAFWDSQERNDPGLNIALYANKNVDVLIEDARQTGDIARRMSDLQKIEDIIAADYPAAFTHSPDFIYAVAKDLKGVTLPEITTPSDRFATIANWYIATEAVWPFLVPKRYINQNQ